MSNKSTVLVGQAGAILQMIDAKGIETEQLQAILSIGLLSDLLDGNINKVNRDDFRSLLGLSSLSVLTSRTPHEVGPLDHTLDLDSFYKTRPGLHVCEDSVYATVAKAKLSKKKPLLRECYFRDLIIEAKDNIIEKRAGKNHHFKELEATLLIAKLLQKQEGGIAGVLINNGKANIFYIAGGLVRVRWVADDQKWDLREYRRGVMRWLAGNRVFSRN